VNSHVIGPTGLAYRAATNRPQPGRPREKINARAAAKYHNIIIDGSFLKEWGRVLYFLRGPESYSINYQGRKVCPVVEQTETAEV
jgi:hypothetical protein